MDGVFARAHLVSSAPGERLSSWLCPGPRRVPARPAARCPAAPGRTLLARPGAQDAVGPHKRFVFTTSFRSLSGLPATIKGQVCSQEKTRVGRGLHMEKCTLQRSCRQRVRFGSVRGDRARHSPSEPTSGRTQRGSGRASCHWFRQPFAAFCRRLKPHSPGGPHRASTGRRSPCDTRQKGGRKEPPGSGTFSPLGTIAAGTPP